MIKYLLIRLGLLFMFITFGLLLRFCVVLKSFLKINHVYIFFIAIFNVNNMLLR